MKILVRLPNWLGDMVMSTAFLQAVRAEYPEARVDVIVKKGLDSLVNFMPGTQHRHVFDKNDSKGIAGVYRFGRSIKKMETYDLFFCLPDSFSSALMAFATRATQRIGFKKELRSVLLTKSYQKPSSLHRVDQYISLLSAFTGKKYSTSVSLNASANPGRDRILLNFNSEAESRRMPIIKASSILNRLIKEMPTARFLCMGSTKDKAHVDEIIRLAGNHERIENKAGQTGSVAELVELIGSASSVLSTDSGPAHIANALHQPTVVLFGAGNENITRPYNPGKLTVLRLGQLPCEPCEKNTCKFGSPKCLELLEEDRIIAAIKKASLS